MTYVIEEKQLNKLPDYFVMQMAGSDNVKLIFEDGTFFYVRTKRQIKRIKRGNRCKRQFA